MFLFSLFGTPCHFFGTLRLQQGATAHPCTIGYEGVGGWAPLEFQLVGLFGCIDDDTGNWIHPVGCIRETVLMLGVFQLVGLLGVH